MDETRLETMARQLEHVERENQRLKLAAVVALAVNIAVVLMGQAPPRKVIKVVEAEQFILKDSKGRNRGGLAVTNDAPSLILKDEDGSNRIGLGVTPNGDPSLELADKDLDSGVELTVRSGAMGLQIHEENKKPRVILGVVNDRPILHLADENGRTRAELIVLSNDTPALSFYDYDSGRDVGRKFLAWLGVSRHGSVTLALVDRKEQSEAQLSVPDGGLPRLHFIDKEGKVIWRAP